MVVAEVPTDPVPAGSAPRRVLPAVALAMVLGGGLAWLGRLLLAAGGSLVVPTLVVAGVGAVLTAAGWTVGRGRPAATSFAVTLGILTLLAAVWTFGVAAPLSLDGSATTRARADLDRLTTTAPGGSPASCVVRTTGGVGPLGAPYRVCGYSPGAHVHPFLVYTAVGDGTRGLGYTQLGAATFPDECARHLVGDWWEWNRDPGAAGRCPVGYAFHGGG